MVSLTEVEMPSSKLKVELAKLLKSEGYVEDTMLAFLILVSISAIGSVFIIFFLYFLLLTRIYRQYRKAIHSLQNFLSWISLSARSVENYTSFQFSFALAYSGSFHFTLRKFRFLKILKLQLPLASYHSRSLRFRITLFHKSEFSQKKRDIFSVPNNSECKRKMFYYPSCFKVSKVSVLGICVILNWFFKEKV